MALKNARDSASHPEYRPDIDGLRAIAVMSVVLFHAFPDRLAGGFIGVDIFFVISGFLISTILLKGLAKNTFSVSDFYQRRIRRIFPALLIVLAAIYGFGWLTLLADEYEQLGKEIAGGAGFISNLVLWSDSGYFDRGAELKPLLHLWSLGIEEQFYLVWPLLLYAAWKNKINLFQMIAGIAVLSFVLNVAYIHKDAVATFYSPLSRFWELLAGAALACLAIREPDSSTGQSGIPAARRPHHSAQWRNVQSAAGMLLIGTGLLLLDTHHAFPGFWALLPVQGAVLIILAGPHAWINRVLLSNRPLVWIGLISYPLYLWHWPLLVCLRIMEGGAEPSRFMRAAAVVAAIILAWLTYSGVEKRVRRARAGGRLAFVLGALMLVIAAGGLATMNANGIESRSLARATVEISQASKDRDVIEPTFQNGRIDVHDGQLAGRTSDAVLFVGDSLMTQYFARLQYLYANPDIKPAFSATFAARPGCRPIPSGNQINSNGRDCDAYYVAVMKLASQPEYKKVVFAANWDLVFSDLAYQDNRVKFSSDLVELRRLGKRIYFVELSPQDPRFAPISLSKDYRRANISGATIQAHDLWISRDVLSRQNTIEYKRMCELAASIDADLIDPFDYFCNADKCQYVSDGKPLYADATHLRASTARVGATFIDRLVQ